MIEPRQMTRTINDIEVVNVSLNEKLYLKDDILPVWVTLDGTMPVLENYVPGRRFVTADFSKITEPGEYDITLSYNVPSYFTLVDSAEETVHVVVLEHQQEEETEEGLGVSE